MSEIAQVLYRKWRPRIFGDLVGQEHIATTLQRAVSEGRTSHAYLFTGPRGTGKTSSARILAKAVNCTGTQNGEPDDTCDNCVAITDGRMLDVIEIDAASNNGVADIRDLRDKIQFTPGSGGFKVYIIDEVHMLSTAAFNALLKTLEEPPSHAILVLATTEADKVPATIISRCQRYDFRRLSNQSVVDRVKFVASEEGFEIDDEALGTVARIAWGSLRDALNLLEQLAVSYQGKISGEQANRLLGLGDTGESVKLASAIIGGDASAALAAINAQAAAGADLRALKAATVEALRAALLIRTGVEDALSHPTEVVDSMRAAASNVQLEHLLHGLAALGSADLRVDSGSPLPLELAVIRAVTGPRAVAAPAARRVAPPQTAARAPQPARPAQTGRPPQQPTQRPQQTSQPPRQAAPRPTARQPADTPGPRAQTADPKWDAFVQSLSRVKGKQFVLGALLRGASSHDLGDGELIVRFAHRSNAERMLEELASEHSKKALDDAATAAYGVKLSVNAVHGAAGPTGESSASSPMDSPLVRTAMAMGARIIDDGSRDGGSQ